MHVAIEIDAQVVQARARLNNQPCLVGRQVHGPPENAPPCDEKTKGTLHMNAQGRVVEVECLPVLGLRLALPPRQNAAAGEVRRVTQQVGPNWQEV